MAAISTSDVASLIQEAYATDFLAWAAKKSVVLQSFTTRSMGTKTVNEPVLATLPHAGWVGQSATAPEGVKPTAKITWGNKQLIAEELAVIVPFHENDIADSSENFVTDIVKAGGQAIAFALDAAVLFGINKPATWLSNSLYQSAVAGGNVFEIGNAVDGEDLSGQILNAAERLTDRYEPAALLAKMGLQYKLSNQRAADGVPIFGGPLQGAPWSDGTVHGLSTKFVTGTVSDGAGGDTLVWDPDVATALIVDPSRVIIGVRQDIQVKLLDQATVGGNINLAERDMLALRFKARYAYVLGDNIAFGSTVSTSSPVAVVTPGGGS